MKFLHLSVFSFMLAMFLSSNGYSAVIQCPSDLYCNKKGCTEGQYQKDWTIHSNQSTYSGTPYRFFLIRTEFIPSDSKGKCMYENSFNKEKCTLISKDKVKKDRTFSTGWDDKNTCDIGAASAQQCMYEIIK